MASKKLRSPGERLLGLVLPEEALGGRATSAARAVLTEHGSHDIRYGLARYRDSPYFGPFLPGTSSNTFRASEPRPATWRSGRYRADPCVTPPACTQWPSPALRNSWTVWEFPGSSDQLPLAHGWSMAPWQRCWIIPGLKQSDPSDPTPRLLALSPTISSELFGCCSGQYGPLSIARYYLVLRPAASTVEF